MLAVIVAAPYLAGAAVMGLGFVSFPLLEAGLLVGGIVAGGLVVNSLFGPSVPDMPGAGSFDDSPTYSWSPVGNMLVEGGVLPVIFGTHRVIPPLIGRYIETIGDKQFFNLSFAVAGNPVDSIGSVRINDTAISQFQGVTYETRLGAVTQQLLQHFGDTRLDVPVGVKLTWPDDWSIGEVYYEDDLVTYGGSFWRSLQDSNTGHTPSEGSWWTVDGNWTTRQTSGNTVEGLIVTFSLPRGLFYANSSGGTDPQTVKINVEYKPIPTVWDSGTTYLAGQRVTYGGTEWKSIQGDNLNNTPSEGSWWTADSSYVSLETNYLQDTEITVSRWSGGSWVWYQTLAG